MIWDYGKKVASIVVGGSTETEPETKARAEARENLLFSEDDFVTPSPFVSRPSSV